MSILSIQNYLAEHFQDCLEAVSEIAKSDGDQPSPIQSAQLMYSFDKINKRIYPESACFCSADALFVRKNCIELIEFKTGFKRRITKQNWKPEKAGCDHLQGGICEDYWKLFWKLEDCEKGALIDSIKDKAVESYVTLEKHILPQQQGSSPIQLRYIAVIDSESMEDYEDALSGLSNMKTTPTNSIGQVKNALSKLCRCKDCEGSPYYYDDIVVCSFQYFQSHLSQYS